MKNTSGFTLIELSVVLIILGLIAALAFPALFAQIERNRGQEALNTMNLIKSGIESCAVQNGYDFYNCTGWDAVGMDEPTGGAFTYIVANTPSGCDGSSTHCSGFTITADRTTSDDTIIIKRDDTGKATCEGIGAFQGFC